MKVLVVCSGNAGYLSPFVNEQVNAIRKFGITVEYFTVIGRGVFGYLKNISLLHKKLEEVQPDIIHAHYGLVGLLSTLQRKYPVVVTFHGSDINSLQTRYYSKLAYLLSRKAIFVSQKLYNLINAKSGNIIPCGTDLTAFNPVPMTEARKYFGFKEDELIVLFAGAFNNPVKNPALAKRAVEAIPGNRIKFLELKGYDRKEVSLLLNAANLLLLTSFSEGSPQVVKEAMACNVPVVATDVGDVKNLFGDSPGHFITSFDPKETSEKIQEALKYSVSTGKTNGRERILGLGLDSCRTAEKVISIYNEILKEK
ncbi:MAG: glycosyltransferase [Ignavibacteriales bacterium]|nr:glycosyltransferase [Ignavibacteriales bacterium]